MLTLHATTDLIKNFVKWSVITVSALVLVFFLFRAGVFLKDVFFPKPPPMPTTPYGKLPQIVFPKSTITQSFTYVLDTKSASLPQFPDRVNVFPIRKNQSTLLNLDRAKTKVEAIRFTNLEGLILPETALSESLYLWQDNSELRRRIQMDIISFNFLFTSVFPDNVASGSSILLAKNMPDEEKAKTVVRSFLGKMSLYPPDIDEEKTLAELLTLRQDGLVSATSLSTANAIRVNLFQKDVERKKIVYPNPPQSPMDFYVASGPRESEVVYASFVHQTVNESNKNATYPIISSQQAFDILGKNEAYIAASFATENEIKINAVYIAYYLGETEQEYLMPVIVFEGNDGFFAYVSAVDTEWIR